MQVSFLDKIWSVKRIVVDFQLLSHSNESNILIQKLIMVQSKAWFFISNLLKNTMNFSMMGIFKVHISVSPLSKVLYMVPPFPAFSLGVAGEFWDKSIFI
jgi:hypothetical protein